MTIRAGSAACSDRRAASPRRRPVAIPPGHRPKCWTCIRPRCWGIREYWNKRVERYGRREGRDEQDVDSRAPARGGISKGVHEAGHGGAGDGGPPRPYSHAFSDESQPVLSRSERDAMRVARPRSGDSTASGCGRPHRRVPARAIGRRIRGSSAPRPNVAVERAIDEPAVLAAFSAMISLSRAATRCDRRG